MEIILKVIKMNTFIVFYSILVFLGALGIVQQQHFFIPNLEEEGKEKSRHHRNDGDLDRGSSTQERKV